ncbi:ABC transporter permease [Salimicrobium halophilum]|uniref:ABC-2 type transport system permease protein n=1 Tax=Salimicrobium halophilum TaxID=86666 RepID=A0A1G8TPB6_9BACI|nr:ABC transporter permease [Salimicrobium halophilum]SDJ43372.1 ABC-2 type transport system permease protein [Salimicrobium halophilum]
MIDAKQFWKERMGEHVKELNRYMRYIFNGHIAVVLFFLFSAGAYFYQQWLQTIPEDFPAAWVVAVVFGSIVTYSPVRTMVKEPDLVFLLPAEYELKDYFRRCLYYSYTVQLYVIFLAAAALGPLYFTVYPEFGMSHYLQIVAGMLVIKAMVILSNWWMLQEREPRIRLLDQAVKWVLSVFLFYFAAVGSWIFTAIVLILLVGLVYYTRYVSRQKAALAWDLLLEKDQARMRAFYRLANMFTDVPHLKSRVKKRKWLVSVLTTRLPFTNEKTYTYLYRITFARSGDYIGMYARLVVIGGLAIWMVPNTWVSVIIGVLFLYLSGFQMITLWHHHRTIAWLDIYPVSLKQRREALVTFLKQLLSTQTLIFVLLFVFQAEWVAGLLMAVGGGLFSILFVETFVRSRLE